MSLAHAPLRAMQRSLAPAETEMRDPAAWFRADPDIWSPPNFHDPDVFGPPIDRSLPQTRPQRPGTNRKVDTRRGPPPKSNAKDAKPVTGRKTATQTLNSARSTGTAKRSTDSSAPNKENNKDDDSKDEDSPEEEKRFEAANHMDGDLVDVLGMFGMNYVTLSYLFNF